MRTFHSLAAVLLFAAMPAASFAEMLPPPPAEPPMPVAVRSSSLHEIGHVTAKTSFCSAFIAGGSPAAESALRFQHRLAITTADFDALDLYHEVAKMRTIRLLEDDALALALDARDGRGELATMRKKALVEPDPNGPANKALIAFADALRGAQGREYELSRQIANLVGTLESMPVPEFAGAPSGLVDSFARPTYTQTRLITDTAVGGDSPIAQHRFRMPGAELIEADLATAATRAERVEALGDCR